MLDTKTRPQNQTDRAEDAAPQTGPVPQQRRRFLRPDVVFGLATGFAVALGFGGPISSTLGVFWRDVVVPAFYTLAQAGLAYCT